MVPIQPWLLGMSMLLGMPNAADNAADTWYTDESTTEWFTFGYWLTFGYWMVSSELKWWSYNLLAGPLRTLLWHVSNYISDVVDQACTVVSNMKWRTVVSNMKWRTVVSIGDDSGDDRLALRLALKDVEADDPHDVEVGARKYYF